MREELKGWRIYTPEPHFRMRTERAPATVSDIGRSGESIAPFLHRLRATFPKYYEHVSRLLRVCIPEVEKLDVVLNEHSGTLALTVLQSGIRYSSRVMSEGTLRAIAYCAIAVNPWVERGLVAIEEPENGVHPRHLESIARLLLSLAEQRERQVIVATHSPLFIGTIAAAKRQSENCNDIGLFHVLFEDGQTVVEPFEIPDALFDDTEIATALSDRGDESVVEGLIMRNMIRV